MSTITIDTQHDEGIQREAERLDLQRRAYVGGVLPAPDRPVTVHRDLDGRVYYRDYESPSCAEDEEDRSVWRLDPQCKGMVINFDPGIFNAREEEGVVTIERTA